MDAFTEEELFELQHQDELDEINDIEIDKDPPEDDLFEFYAFKLNESSSLQTENILSNNKVDQIDKEPAKSNESHPVEDSCKFQDEEISFDFVANKENVQEEWSAKRKLLFSQEDVSNPGNGLSEIAELEDTQQESESLISERPKRPLSEIFIEQEDHDENSAKRQCLHSNNTVLDFLKDKMQTQARSTLFDESSRSFLQDQVTLTCSDGRRVYFSLRNEDEKSTVLNFSERTYSLLTTSIYDLKSQYFIMEEEKMLQKENSSMLENTETLVPNLDDLENSESSLWVEKYRPLSYMHLLSEEGINRTLLQWLKLWDKVVFGREKKAKKKIVEPNKNAKFQKPFGELIEELDEHGRPHHKVAFLCGPPGLGKTTLSTIIAKHAGYNVIELNASDDRNPEAFRTSLEAATQMKAVLHQDHKPNCLILDEIDGAPAPSINVLLSFVKSTGITKGKRKKGDIPLLMRPVICICNDQYSVTLKPLRQLALVLNFPPTTASRLTSRLHEIIFKEGLKAEMAALTLLCEKASNDIRSCLSTLQFIHRIKKELKVSDLKGLQIGQKDIQKSLFGVWQDVFYFKDKVSFPRIHEVIQSVGDYEKVYIGLFENYVNMKVKHRNLDTVWKGAEWLCFGDIIQQQINHSQLYILLPYLPYPAVAFHLLYASNAFPHISYPSTFYEHKAKRSQLLNILSSMMKEVVSSSKSFLNSTILLTDVFPVLLEIIKPTLRPVNTQLYSEREKSELRRVIELMMAFNLNYRQERLLDGTYSYVLDPNIEELTKFSDIKSKRILTYSAKQMIAREVEVEQMRKGDSSINQETSKPSDRNSQVTPKSSDEIKLPVQKEPVKNAVAEKPMLDFFGRRITEEARAKAKAKNIKKGDPRDEKVWFHFKEGYSNAVRKTVYIKDLL